MNIYCTERFKSEFKKLIKYNSYKILERQVIDNFFNCSDDQIRHGTTISSSSYRSVVKKRIGGRGGFRAYFYVYVMDNKIYLSYIYPKTGSEGKISLSKAFRKLIIDETDEAIDRNDLFEISVLNGRLDFISTRSN
ncbi:hypothetical protein [Dyadobacter arcticus]|uniref:Type II toxin-antitoxin system RelE/ParE family toxin n=1 Tax=Dyadobacter arcticus TaxID=1078754 RepID=A0ABX0UML1_9BACT|nr:hypothetical protein [Dyadobacter arcticus]NIJ52860.1 hypothetical protein [Dyadobacter arcticus]